MSKPNTIFLTVVIISITYMIIKFLYDFSKKISDQDLNVGRISIRILTINDEIYDITFQGKAVYDKSLKTFYVLTAKKVFSKWKNNESGLIKINNNHWINVNQIKQLYLVSSNDYYVNVKTK